jgi:hypothetical protein
MSVSLDPRVGTELLGYRIEAVLTGPRTRLTPEQVSPEYPSCSKVSG